MTFAIVKASSKQGTKTATRKLLSMIGNPES
jgi:hypothetical protein